MQRTGKYFSEDDKLIGMRINEFLKKKGKTQGDLASGCFPNVTLAQINRRLNGVNSLTVGEYKAICDYLDVDYDTFFYD